MGSASNGPVSLAFSNELRRTYDVDTSVSVTVEVVVVTVEEVLI